MIRQSKIAIQNLNFYYHQKRVIHNLNLEISANEILSILGPANSGITTLLRALNRLTDLTPEAHMEGEILLDGKNIYDHDVNVTELCRTVGMVFDVPTPLPMSVFANVAYGPRLSGKKSKRAVLDSVEQALRMAALWDDVKDRLNVPAMTLSGGQQQRLCIARALAVSPDVLLMDEPTSALDPVSTSKIEDLVSDLKNKYTIVIVTHNMQQATRVSDKTAFFLLGEMVEYGDTRQIFSMPRDKRTEDYITGRFG